MDEWKWNIPATAWHGIKWAFAFGTFMGWRIGKQRLIDWQKKKKKKKKPVTVCEEDEKTFEGGLQGGKPQPTGMYVGSCKVSDEFSALMVQRFYLARCFNSLMIIHPTTPELHVA